ncbi:MAG: hypothetical protein WKG00_21015 [Polyangiaceae bacterium]
MDAACSRPSTLRCASRAATLALALTLGACGKKADDAPPQAAAAPAPASPDELRPGELAEGQERAFGLPLPRHMRISARFPDAVFATGAMSPEHVANYVRERVVADAVETGPAKTVFTRAKLKAGDDKTVIRIEVAQRGADTELVVRDQTPPPIKPGLTPEERMREHGMTLDGKLIDPKRLQ